MVVCAVSEIGGCSSDVVSVRSRPRMCVKSRLRVSGGSNQIGSVGLLFDLVG